LTLVAAAQMCIGEGIIAAGHPLRYHGGFEPEGTEFAGMLACLMRRSHWILLSLPMRRWRHAEFGQSAARTLT
jgi:hypothetical protein